MSLRVHEDFGAAELNKAVKAMEIQSIGPVGIETHNLGQASVVVSVEKLSDGSTVLTDDDTAVAAEATGYTGNDSDLEFSGESLDNTSVIPGSVVVTPATSGPVLKDDLRDGKLYTDDDDHDLAGTIDYFTGALSLSYPTGKAPNGAISADYAWQGSDLAPGGKKFFKIPNVLQEETLIVKVAADAVAGSRVKVNAVSSWDQ